MSRASRAKAVVDADQVELQAMRDGVSSSQVCIRDDEMSDLLADEFRPIPPTEGAEDLDWEAEANDRIAAPEAGKDQINVGAIDELRRRADLLGPDYPFKLVDSSLEYTGGSTLVYEFCLAATSSPSVTQGEYANLPRAFERLAGTVVRLWLGRDAKAYRTGWPPDGDRPTTLSETMEELGRRLDGEWSWSPRDSHYEKTVTGDAGLDLVVWMGPPDHRHGRLVMMGQCACGNWEGKLTDVDFNRLGNHCKLPLAGKVRFLAISGHIGHEKTWKDALTQGGIVFDRVRLTRIAEAAENRDAVTAEAKRPYEELIKIVLPGFRRLDRDSS